MIYRKHHPVPPNSRLVSRHNRKKGTQRTIHSFFLELHWKIDENSHIMRKHHDSGNAPAVFTQLIQHIFVYCRIFFIISSPRDVLYSPRSVKKPVKLSQRRLKPATGIRYLFEGFYTNTRSENCTWVSRRNLSICLSQVKAMKGEKGEGGSTVTYAIAAL